MEIPFEPQRSARSSETEAVGAKAGRLGGEGRFAGAVAHQRGGASFRQSNGDRDEDGMEIRKRIPARPRTR